MRKTALILSFCLATCQLLGQGAGKAELPLTLAPAWKVFLNVEAPASYAEIPAALKASGSGSQVAPKTAKVSGDTVDLAALAGSFEPGSCAVLYNEFQADKAGRVQAGASADWWMELYVNGDLVYSTMAKGNGTTTYKTSDHLLSFPVKAGRNLLAAKVKSGSAGWRFVCGVPEPPKPNIKFEANAEWKAAGPVELFIKEGSALDQSGIAKIPFVEFMGRPRLPRLGVGPTGRLVAENNPAKPLRLRGTTINFPWVIGDVAKESAWKSFFDANSAASARQGYNLLRTGFDLGSHAATFKPETLDKVDYLLDSLGRHGVYTYLICGVQLPASWQAGPEVRDYPLRMYLGDEEVRASWKKGVETFMAHVNPYSGLAWKDDPAIACVELFNEQEWGFMRPNAQKTKDTLSAKFRQWLEAKYKNVEALNAAWDGTPLKSFSDASAPDSFPPGGRKPSDNDFILFCAELSHKSAAWMRDTLRATGYKGLVAQYNISHWLAGQEARWGESQVSIANTYHNHPSDFNKPGSKCGQGSSLSGAGAYWRGIASMRFADRPFMETEFNHSFWNPYQYECGPLFGAYSALQGMDALVIHASATFTRSEKPADIVNVFSVGRSPVSRAGEFLSGCLFLRGDVQTSPHRVEVQVSKEYLEADCNGGRAISWEQSKLALLTGFSVAFPWARKAEGVGVAPAPDVVMTPSGGASFKSAGGGWAVDSIERKNPKSSLAATLAGMKAKGILPKDNISDASKELFQSDTGEITMRCKEKLLKIVTPRSEAVTLEAGKGEPLGRLNVLNSSVPGMAAACAVDGKPLADSRRIVLLYSTEVANSGLELSADRVTLVNLGRMPILIKTGVLEATLKNSNGAKMALYALGFDGSRREKLPLEFADGLLKIKIDTAKLKNGPTPFFELVVE